MLEEGAEEGEEEDEKVEDELVDPEKLPEYQRDDDESKHREELKGDMGVTGGGAKGTGDETQKDNGDSVAAAAAPANPTPAATHHGPKPSQAPPSEALSDGSI